MTESELADIYKALSVPSRIKILKLIAGKQLCVNAITRFLEISQPAVSQHLAILRRVGLVTSERGGYLVHYTLNRKRLAEFNGAVAEILGKEFVTLDA
jgi:DNA-binding transcriptional ArsR family regulator